MMKKFLLVGALICSIIGTVASAATATAPLLVAGTGASTVSGRVVVGASATGPATGPFFPVAPAVGFVRTRGSFFGDLTGTVTCIGIAQGGRAAIVSGNLNKPFVSGGFSYANFSLLISAGATAPWIEILPDNLEALGPCGTSLFFAAGIPSLPSDTLLRGRFAIINGTSVVIINGTP